MLNYPPGFYTIERGDCWTIKQHEAPCLKLMLDNPTLTYTTSDAITGRLELEIRTQQFSFSRVRIWLSCIERVAIGTSKAKVIHLECLTSMFEAQAGVQTFSQGRYSSALKIIIHECSAECPPSTWKEIMDPEYGRVIWKLAAWTEIDDGHGYIETASETAVQLLLVSPPQPSIEDNSRHLHDKVVLVGNHFTVTALHAPARLPQSPSSFDVQLVLSALESLVVNSVTLILATKTCFTAKQDRKVVVEEEEIGLLEHDGILEAGVQLPLSFRDCLLRSKRVVAFRTSNLDVSYELVICVDSVKKDFIRCAIDVASLAHSAGTMLEREMLSDSDVLPKYEETI